MGTCPADYELFKAAQWMHVPPWVLAEQSIWWKYKALDYMSAEAEGQEILNNRK